VVFDNSTIPPWPRTDQIERATSFRKSNRSATAIFSSGSDRSVAVMRGKQLLEAATIHWYELAERTGQSGDEMFC
jgi:hypothetical protein